MKLFMFIGIFYFLPSFESSEYNPFQFSKETEAKLEKIKNSKKQKDSGRIVRAKLGKPAPDWKGPAVINGTFQDISLSDYKGKYLVFLFYPLDFTFVCPTEIRAFNNRINEFRKINTEVVAVSVDSQFAHMAWINTPPCDGGLGNVTIPLLSDLSHEISKTYGVYSSDVNHAFRGLFLIDPKGVIRHVTLNDMHVGRNVDETLRLVQAYQHTDTHGEVCPAGWKPGEKTIVIQPCLNSLKAKNDSQSGSKPVKAQENNAIKSESELLKETEDKTEMEPESKNKKEKGETMPETAPMKDKSDKKYLLNKLESLEGKKEKIISIRVSATSFQCKKYDDLIKH